MHELVRINANIVDLLRDIWIKILSANVCVGERNSHRGLLCDLLGPPRALHGQFGAPEGSTNRHVPSCLLAAERLDARFQERLQLGKKIPSPLGIDLVNSFVGLERRQELPAGGAARQVTLQGRYSVQEISCLLVDRYKLSDGAGTLILAAATRQRCLDCVCLPTHHESHVERLPCGSAGIFDPHGGSEVDRPQGLVVALFERLRVRSVTEHLSCQLRPNIGVVR